MIINPVLFMVQSLKRISNIKKILTTAYSGRYSILKYSVRTAPDKAEFISNLVNRQDKTAIFLKIEISC